MRIDALFRWCLFTSVTRTLLCACVLLLLAGCITHSDHNTVHVAGYSITTSRTPDGGGVLQILQAGTLVHRQTNESGAFYVGPNTPETDNMNKVNIRPGQDITGAGIPDLVVTEWTGGVHCCYNAYVFELGQLFRFVGKFEGGDGGVRFREVNRTGRYEVVSGTNVWRFVGGRYQSMNRPQP